MQEVVRFRGIHKIRDPFNSSTRNLQDFFKSLSTGCQSQQSDGFLPWRACPIRSLPNARHRHSSLSIQQSIIGFRKRFFNNVPYVERRWTVSINLFHHTAFDPANFFSCLLRTNIIFADVKNHVLNKLERMTQH